MQNKILVTGSEGLIGTAIIKELKRRGTIISPFDLRAKYLVAHGDVRDYRSVASSMRGCSGVIHLAAVSRVLWGEQDPALCWETNVKGTENVLKAASRMDKPPWVIFASSREVYGQPQKLPVSEDSPLAPINIYGRSKAEGEELVNKARINGLTTAIARFSNVYGSILDHPDRVVPAFARAAVQGETLRVDGPDHVFDFNYLEDTAHGLAALVLHLEKGKKDLPPIHFVTGTPTTLGELSDMAIALAHSRSATVQSAPRSYDVARFVGNPSRANDLLGWVPQIGLRDGLERLIQDYRELERKGSAA